MTEGTLNCDVVIVGAGMAGLTAARQLQHRGLSVVVLDKGRAVGGRMATRRIGEARFDHGAQHFSARSADFAREVDAWKQSGHARVWYRSGSLTNPDRGVEDRHAGSDGMRNIPEYLASGIDVLTGVTVRQLRRDGGGVLAEADRVSVIAREAAIATAPVPQLVDMLGPLAATAEAARLNEITYDPCLAVMAELDGPAGLDDGHLALDGPAVWIADNQHKGVSPVPAVTIHSSPEYAAAHLETDPDRWVGELLQAGTRHLLSDIVSATGHRWRYAQPRATRDDGCVVIGGGTSIVLAGEAFAGARVEGAYLSGMAAAAAVENRSV